MLAPPQKGELNHLRCIMIDWLILASHSLKLGKSTLVLCVRIFDAYIARTSATVDKDNIQLYGIASLLLASYTEDVDYVDINSLSVVACLTWSADEINKAAEDIFATIGCTANLPNDMKYIHSRRCVTCKYLIVISLMAGCDYLPSVRAAACESICPNGRKNRYGVPQEAIDSCTSNIARAHTHIEATALDSYKKWFPNVSITVEAKPLSAKSTTHTIGVYFKHTTRLDLVEHQPGDPIGKGISGVVTKCTYENTVYAAKTYNHNHIGVSYVRELSILRTLQHPNVVSLKYSCTNMKSILLEIADIDLSSLVREHGPMLKQTQVSLAKDLLSGLSYIHSRGVLHRDIKPPNVLVFGNPPTFKLCDFGSSRCQVTSERMQYTQGVCTMWYRSPEVLLGDTYDDKHDVWSLMCTLYECATASPLFPGSNDWGQLEHIYFALGKPDETTWPGVSKLKGYRYLGGIYQHNPCTFEWNSRLCTMYKKILPLGLTVYPAKRPTSNELHDLIQ